MTRGSEKENIIPTITIKNEFSRLSYNKILIHVPIYFDDRLTDSWRQKKTQRPFLTKEVIDRLHL